MAELSIGNAAGAGLRPIQRQLAVAVIWLLAGFFHAGSTGGRRRHVQGGLRRSPGKMQASAAPLPTSLGLMSVPLTERNFALVGGAWARAFRDLSGSDLAANFS